MTKKNTTKKATASTIGVPKPPFLIMEPNGAPIKKSTIQAKAKIYLANNFAIKVQVLN